MSSKSIGIVAHGRAIGVSVTASSVESSLLDATGCNALHIVNTSTTLYVAVRWGVGSQTAVLTTDITIPPMGQIIVGCNPLVTNVAGIGSGAGPTHVKFTPCRVQEG